MKASTVWDCDLLLLPRIQTESGAITALNNLDEVPFSTKRVYYLYDVPGGAERGGHAHKGLFQLIIAASGSFDVVIDDGKIKRIISLNRPYQGLLVVPGIWREIINFSSGSICLVLASEMYDKDDYIRIYDEFKKVKHVSP